MWTEVTEAPIVEYTLRAKLAQNGDIGAVVSFSGLVREVSGKDEVFTLEHYPGMTEKMLKRIAEEATNRFALHDALIVHRVGEMRPSDVIVVVIAASRHRQAAFDGASYMMDYLKTRAPFWKKEAGGSWVEARESDEDAFARWNRPENGE